MYPIDNCMDSLFIFRRDLRLEDNTALSAAIKDSDRVVPCFIFDPGQVGDGNEYRSNNSLQFMIESLHDLERQLEKSSGRLFLFYGKTDEVVSRLLKERTPEAVYINRDYTPYSAGRDAAVGRACRMYGAELRAFSDCLLNEPESIMKNDGKPYTVFTHFYNRSVLEKVRTRLKGLRGNYCMENIPFEQESSIYEKILREKNDRLAVRGGRKEALDILGRMERFGGYAKEKDIPALDATTHLSAHLKYGTCSVREAYHSVREKLGPAHPLIRQFYWRDFFTHIGYHFPRVFGKPFNERFDRIKWSYDRENFDAWCAGRTGFPIVDAGMRELVATGYMHNRVRMIAASFLVKDLHIDWRWGERYFAQKLVDYDPCVNNGNWQWSASTGCDAQPYFRIFNPWLQQKRYDPECRYVKKWVPELSGLAPKEIQSLHIAKRKINGYPTPLVVHEAESGKAKELFRNAL